MRIILSEIPADKVVGSYGPNGDKAKPKLRADQLVAEGSMPARARFLHPLAAASYVRDLHPAGVAVSDMYRSAESSLAAVTSGRGALPPGYSGHNYGFCIDIRVADCLKRLASRGIPVKKKGDLDAWMREKGWYCHRTDGLLESESWHYNALLVFADVGGALPSETDLRKFKTTSGWLEQLIVKMYRDQMFLTDMEAQASLASLGFYRGAQDGIVGPQTKSAVAAFQRAWIPSDVASASGKLDDRTRRTLAFLSATRSIEPIPACA